MGKSIFLRRAVAAVGFIGVGLVAQAAFPESAPPLSSDAHFRAIRVDVAPLANNAGDPTATWMAQALPGPLNAVFASRLAPGDRSAPTLVVRIDSVFLGESGNGIFDATGADRARDNVQGVGIVVAPNGRAIASYPIFDVLYNYTGGSNYEVGTERRRINDLAASLAHWLPGQMGL
jgi:hypothetical protein